MEGTLQSRPTAATRDGDDAGCLEPWDGSCRFCCLLQCSNPRCEEILLCGGKVSSEGDVSYGYSDLVSCYRPTTLVALDAGHEMAEVGGRPAAATEIVAPVRLDPSDEKILRLLASDPSLRLKTPEIAQQTQLNKRSIGKNLSRLTSAGLLGNEPRRGYSITEAGKERASQL